MARGKKKSTFPVPGAWNRDTADTARDEHKRNKSPCSFFCSQGQSLVLAAEYFKDDRLETKARGGVALKHRHRIHLALFGQMMASFEYLLKDFVAKAIDITSILDPIIMKAKCVDTSPEKILAARNASTTPGAMLVHSTLGWHSPITVNERYQELFTKKPISGPELQTLERLWIIRHTVAHNAGFVIQYDASRLGADALSDKVANIDGKFIQETFDLLKPIAKRIADLIGTELMRKWLESIKPSGADFSRDETTYVALKNLGTIVESRIQDLPNIKSDEYKKDFGVN